MSTDAVDLSGLLPQLKKGAPEVEAAFALGWHMSELFGLPGESTATAPPPAQLLYLPPPKKLDRSQLFELLKTQIGADLGRLLSLTGDNLSQDARQQLSAAASLALPGPDAAAFRAQVLELDGQLLQALTDADYRLEKSYSIGRAMCTVTAQRTLNDLKNVGIEGGLFSLLAGWLRDLKSAFATGTCDATVVTLLQWQAQASDEAPDTEQRFNVDHLQRQGEIWRSMLSGEKLPTDYLNLGDYLTAGRNLMGHYAALAATILSPWRLWIAGGVVVVLLATAGAIYLHLDAAVIGIGAAVLGLFGVTSATVTAAVRQVLQLVQAPLWEAEITDAMIVCMSLADIPEERRGQIIEDAWRQPKFANLRRVQPKGRHARRSGWRLLGLNGWRRR